MSSPVLWGPNNTSNNLQSQILLSNGQLLSNDGPKNYIKYGSIDKDISNWVLGNATLTSNFPSGTPTFGSGASGNLSISVIASGQLSGLYSLSYASSAATTAGNFLSSSTFTIDAEDQAKVLSFKFSYKVQSGTVNMSGTSSNSFGVAIYDVTNSAWVQPAGVFNLVQSSGVGIATGTFQTASNGSSYRLVIYNANATSGAVTMYFDSFFVGPQVTSVGPAMSDWSAITGFTVSNFTNIGTITSLYKQTGDTYDFQVNIPFIGATVATGSFVLNLPSGITIDTAKLISMSGGSPRIPNSQGQYLSNGVKQGGLSVHQNNSTSIYVVVDDVSTTYPNDANLTATIPATWKNTDAIAVSFSLPIVGKSSNTVQSADTDTRVVAASFFGYYSSTTALTQIPLTTIVDKTGSKSGNTWIVPVSGVYKINGVATFSSANASLNDRSLKIYIDGVVKVSQVESSSFGSNIAVVGMYELKAGQVISFYGESATIASAVTDFYGTIERLSGPAVVQATETVAACYKTNSGQSIPNGSASVVLFGTKDSDSHNSYNTSTGLFAAPVSGSYLVSAEICFASVSVTAGADQTLNIYKNGSAIASGLLRIWNTTTTVAGTISVQKLVQMNAGDTIGFYAGHGESSARALLSNSALNFFQIVRIGN